MRRIGLAALGLWISTACVARDGEARYILNGFHLSGLNVDPDPFLVGLQQRAGDRISAADIAADTQLVSTALAAKHIEGKLYATLAAKDGRVWVLFDFYPERHAPDDAVPTLVAQHFQGNATITTGELERASGLHPGIAVPAAAVQHARETLLGAYQKDARRCKVSIKGVLRRNQAGEADLTWIVEEHPCQG